MKKPAPTESLVAMVTATAVASVGTPAGSGMVIAPPTASRPVRSRVSSRRVGAVATNRPAVAPAAATKAPVTSTTTWADALELTASVPSAPVAMIAPFARVSPAA